MNSHKAFAVALALQAGEIMRKNFSLDMKKKWKNDSTPVTVTDLAINTLVLKAVRKSFPTHSFIGEEESQLLDSEYSWVCDPVDGTIPFSHGYPTFVFSLALVKNGLPILGIIYDAILNRLVVAEKGEGATLNDKQILVSSAPSITNTSLINCDTFITLPKLQPLIVSKTSCFISTLCSADYSSMLVACGEILAEICTSPHPWDAAAVKIIVEEAGGKVTDLQGREQRYDRPIHGFIASNSFIHDELISYCTLAST